MDKILKFTGTLCYTHWQKFSVKLYIHIVFVYVSQCLSETVINCALVVTYARLQVVIVALFVKARWHYRIAPGDACVVSASSYITVL